MFKAMKLHEIITINADPKKSILYELLHPYLNSLYIFYKDLYNCEPVVMVTEIFNAAQYVKIVSSNEFFEAIDDYLEKPFEDGENFVSIPEDTTSQDLEDYDNQVETINFNSKLLKDLI